MRNFILKTFVVFSLTLVGLVSCKKKEIENNQLSEQEKKDGWQLLFDGQTTSGWHLYNKGDVPSAWMVVNEELYCNPDTFDIAHGDLVTDKEFRNFDLKFDWKISKEGNSGVFINVLERGDIPTAWASGPEYQLLEKSHPDYAVSPKKRAGCLYGFSEQKNEAPTKPFGNWNSSEIKQKDGKIQFYLNGILTAEQDLNTQVWRDSVAASGFKTFPEFGKYTKGHIAFQDWSKGISFRNIKIKTL